MAEPPSNPKVRKSTGFWLAMAFYTMSAIWFSRHAGGGVQSEEPASKQAKKLGKVTFIVAVPLISLVFASFLNFYFHPLVSSTLGAGFVLVSGSIAAYRQLGDHGSQDSTGIRAIAESEYAYLLLGGACLFVPEFYSSWLTFVVPVIRALCS